MNEVLSEQVGGDHYKKLAIQPVELIVKLNLDYFKGNIVKYITRHRFKNGKEDIEKAKHYALMHEQYSKKAVALASKLGFTVVAKQVDKYAEANYLTLLERNAIYYACIGSHKNLIETLNKIIKEYDEE